MLKQHAKNLTQQNEQGKEKLEEPNSKKWDFEPVELDTTLFVKNLNFMTQEESLKKVTKYEYGMFALI